jgi:glucans biosynthesis protein
MHGGKSTGAPKGNKNAWKHGHYSKGAKAERALLKNLLTEAASLRKLLSKSES